MDTALSDPRIRAMIGELAGWPGPAIASHKSANQFFHKLAFLADRGVTPKDEGMGPVVERVLARRDGDGVPRLPVNIGEAYGGTGVETFGWALCDAPTVLYALAKMGYRDAGTDSAVESLAGLLEPFGWGCRVSPELGSWRGPGKKTDPCPYATLLMVKLLAQYDGARYRERIRAGAAVLLDLWERSRDRHPYIFYMGDDFRKLKLPFIWYDILHVCEVLSRVPSALSDPRFSEMLGVVEGKARQGRYAPESVYQAFKDWDFGQKKAPSATLERTIADILSRAGR